MSSSICDLRDSIYTVILDPLFLLLFTLGFLVFVWGVVEFLWAVNAGSKEEGKANGKRHMLYGVIGLFIMFAAYGIVQLVINSVDTNALGSALDCLPK